MGFRDHFSNHAVHYEAYRPTYPDDLFAYLAGLSPSRTLALDCATGNGQAAVGLMPHFRSVVALDASRKQLDLASIRDRIIYVQALADQTPLPSPRSIWSPSRLRFTGSITCGFTRRFGGSPNLTAYLPFGATNCPPLVTTSMPWFSV